MTIKYGIAVLAAGKGTRMNLKVPKVLAPLLGYRLIDYTLNSYFLSQCDNDKLAHLGIIVGHRGDEVKNYLLSELCPHREQLSKLSSHNLIAFPLQEQQNGTGHALQCYMESKLSQQTDYTFIVCADTPLLPPHVFSDLLKRVTKQKDIDGCIATFELKNPYGYGRVALDDQQGGLVSAIIEEKDCTEMQRRIHLVNSGVYLVKTSFLQSYLSKLEKSAVSGEYYLTDIFSKGRFLSVIFDDSNEFMGVNDQEQLEVARSLLLEKKIRELRRQGVYIEDSKTLHLDWGVKVESGATVGAHVSLKGRTVIGKDTIIEPSVVVIDSQIGAHNCIKSFSHLEGVKSESGCSIGPFARLRPLSQLDKDVKVGNFVEIKKSHLRKGAKVSHLSYVGDANIGKNVNLGCGFITCNYDGKNKHETIIGENTFIGSDCQMIAPVSVGDNCFVAAGTTLTKSVPDGGFAIGRSQQVTKEHMASRFLKSPSQNSNKGD